MHAKTPDIAIKAKYIVTKINNIHVNSGNIQFRLFFSNKWFLLENDQMSFALLINYMMILTHKNNK